MSLKNHYIFGPDNPHPLSNRKTELIWEGKYDEYGNRWEINISGIAIPMQSLSCHNLNSDLFFYRIKKKFR
jgi:adenine-specific DNA-methyltransferase